MISIIHPSRLRPTQAKQTHDKWLSRSSTPIEYLLSLDLSDPRRLDYKGFDHIVLNDNRTAIQAINHAATLATGDILIVVSDDFDCVDGWDEKLLAAVDGMSDFIVKTPDGYQKTLMTLPIMDRKYYQRFGYVYEPGYKHLWCDTEMTVVAHMLGRVVNVDVLFEHLHHSLGKSIKDDISKKNDATWKQGQAHFNERLKTNFGISKPLVKYKDIVW